MNRFEKAAVMSSVLFLSAPTATQKELPHYKVIVPVERTMHDLHNGMIPTDRACFLAPNDTDYDKEGDCWFQDRFFI